MNANELVIADIHTLQKVLRETEKAVQVAKQSEQDAIARARDLPDKVIASLNLEIASKTKVRDALDSEIAVKTASRDAIHQQGIDIQLSNSGSLKKHKEEELAALLRLTTLEQSIACAKSDKDEHDKRTVIALEASKRAQDERTEEERRMLHLQSIRRDAEAESVVIQKEIEEHREFLTRYRSDRLNLEEWERVLRAKEKYLIEWANNLQHFGLPHA